MGCYICLGAAEPYLDLVGFGLGLGQVWVPQMLGSVFALFFHILAHCKILFYRDHYRLQNTELFSKNDKFGQKITKNANNVKFVTKKRQIQ